LGNLPQDATDEDIYSHFAGMGLSPKKVNVVKDDAGRCKGFGFAKFDDAQFPLALKQLRFHMRGMLVSVRVAVPFRKS
jgi:RNA recognition motif-containing protein